MTELQAQVPAQKQWCPLLDLSNQSMSMSREAPNMNPTTPRTRSQTRRQVATTETRPRKLQPSQPTTLEMGPKVEARGPFLVLKSPLMATWRPRTRIHLQTKPPKMTLPTRVLKTLDPALPQQTTTVGPRTLPTRHPPLPALHQIPPPQALPHLHHHPSHLSQR